MIYIIDEKPYIKVANYYREVDIKKKGNEYYVIPKKGEETKLEYVNQSKIGQMSVEDFYKKNLFNSNKMDISLEENR
ncbi:MAG: hypothetical protein IJ223_07060 [Clostridia bacterium]|nr:hypothetical protein [Clostridia bacterium]